MNLLQQHNKLLSVVAYQIQKNNNPPQQSEQFLRDKIFMKKVS